MTNEEKEVDFNDVKIVTPSGNEIEMNPEEFHIATKVPEDEGVKETVMSLLTEDKPKWHNLRKDPNDLPENFDEPYFLCVLGEDVEGCMLVMFYNEENHTFGMWGWAKDGQHKFLQQAKTL